MYIVVHRYSDVIYEVRDKGERTKVMHHDRLIPHLSEDLPEWVVSLRERKVAQATV